MYKAYLECCSFGKKNCNTSCEFDFRETFGGGKPTDFRLTIVHTLFSHDMRKVPLLFPILSTFSLVYSKTK